MKTIAILLAAAAITAGSLKAGDYKDGTMNAVIQLQHIEAEIWHHRMEAQAAGRHDEALQLQDTEYQLRNLQYEVERLGRLEKPE